MILEKRAANSLQVKNNDISRVKLYEIESVSLLLLKPIKMEVNNNSDVCIYLTSRLIPVQLFSFTCTKELFGKSEIFNGPQKNDCFGHLQNEDDSGYSVTPT